MKTFTINDLRFNRGAQSRRYDADGRLAPASAGHGGLERTKPSWRRPPPLRRRRRLSSSTVQPSYSASSA